MRPSAAGMKTAGEAPEDSGGEVWHGNAKAGKGAEQTCEAMATQCLEQTCDGNVKPRSAGQWHGEEEKDND